MAKEKKRPSKSSKAAQKAVSESKLLTVAKTAHNKKPGNETRSSVVSPRTSTAIKSRPHKKRG